MPREQARNRVFLGGRRLAERVLSRGACDHTRLLAGTLGLDASAHEKANYVDLAAFFAECFSSE
jgi:hypothetical protein